MVVTLTAEAPLPGAECPPATELPGEYSLFAGCLFICTGSIVTRHSQCTSFDPSRPPDCPRTDITIRKQYGTVCKSTDYLCSSPSCATYVSHSLLSVPLFPHIKKKNGAHNLYEAHITSYSFDAERCAGCHGAYSWAPRS